MLRQPDAPVNSHTADPPRLRSAAVARQRVARLRALLPDPGPAVADELDKLDTLIEQIHDGFGGILDDMRKARALSPELAALCTSPSASGDLRGGPAA